MRIYVQWARSVATDYENLTSLGWKGARGGPDLTHLPEEARAPLTPAERLHVQRLCVQGVEFTADHYAVEDLPGGACRVWAWNDDPKVYPAGLRHARVWTFERLAPDPAHNGAYNTRQSQEIYAEPGMAARMVQYATPAEKIRPWGDFTPPADALTLHGRMLPAALADAHDRKRTLHGWREWTDGLPAREIKNGRLRPQRPLGRYVYPDGTRTYYLTTANLANGVEAATHEDAMSTTNPGTGPTEELSNNLGGGASELAFVFSSPSNEPDNATWPTGAYRVNLDCQTAGGDVTYGVLTVGSADGRFQRVNSGLSSSVEAKSQADGAYSGTGVNIATTGSVSWSGSTQSDRWTVSVACGRPANHGNQNFGLDLDEADDWTDGPWAGASTDYSETAPEAGTAAETVTKIAAYTRTNSEAGTAAETVAVAQGWAVVVTEAGTAAETVTAIEGKAATVPEAATAAEAVTKIAEWDRTVAEASTAAEAVSKVAAYDRTVNEAGTAAETLEAIEGKAFVSPEAVTATESVTKIAEWDRVVAEAGTGAAQTSVLATYDRVVAESATGAETVTDSLISGGTEDTVPEAATAVETALTGLGYLASEAGTAAETVTDSLVTVGATEEVVTEATTAAEAVSRIAEWDRVVAEAGTGAESVTAGAGYLATEAGTAAESVTSGAGYLAAEAGTGAETVTVGVELVALETGTAAESTTGGLVTAATEVTVTEGATAAESATTGLEYLASDASAATESVPAALGYLATEAGTAAESAPVLQGVVRVESATATEAVTALVAWDRVVGEPAVAAESVPRVVAWGRIVNEAGTAAEDAAPVMGYTNSEAATAAESVVSELGLLASEVGTATETATSIGPIKFVASEAGAASEAVAVTFAVDAEESATVYEQAFRTVPYDFQDPAPVTLLALQPLTFVAVRVHLRDGIDLYHDGKRIGRQQQRRLLFGRWLVGYVQTNHFGQLTLYAEPLRPDLSRPRVWYQAVIDYTDIERCVRLIQLGSTLTDGYPTTTRWGRMEMVESAVYLRY